MVTRRNLIEGVTALGLIKMLGGCGTSSLTRSTTATDVTIDNLEKPDTIHTYVLVHGAWHGGWCWRDVRAGLEALGHTVYAPTLTGLAEKAHLLTPQVGLNTHIADVVSVIKDNDLANIILVGHSYGGMIITGVADTLKQRIEHIIYLDAALPKDGQTMIS